MKAGIVGCGSISATHLDVLIKLGIDITALCDIDAGNAEKKRDCFSLNSKVYSSYDEMLDNEEFDVIHICTPHYLHCQMAVKALDKGINVLVEKPVCISEEEKEIIGKALEKSKAKLGVCFQNRYLDNSRLFKELLRNQKIINCSAQVLWSREENYYRAGQWRGIAKQSGGGVLINQAIHTLDLILWFFGMPRSVTGFTDTLGLNSVIEVEDVLAGYLEFNGFNAILFSSVLARKDYPVVIKILTDKHLYVFKNGELYEDGKLIERNKSRDIAAKPHWGEGHYLLIKDFYDCVENNKEFMLGLDEGYKAVDITLKLYSSQGKVMRLSSNKNCRSRPALLYRP